MEYEAAPPAPRAVAAPAPTVSKKFSVIHDVERPVTPSLYLTSFSSQKAVMAQPVESAPPMSLGFKFQCFCYCLGFPVFLVHISNLDHVRQKDRRLCNMGSDWTDSQFDGARSIEPEADQIFLQPDTPEFTPEPFASPGPSARSTSYLSPSFKKELGLPQGELPGTPPTLIDPLTSQKAPEESPPGELCRQLLLRSVPMTEESLKNFEELDSLDPAALADGLQDAADLEVATDDQLTAAVEVSDDEKGKELEKQSEGDIAMEQTADAETVEELFGSAPEEAVTVPEILEPKSKASSCQVQGITFCLQAEARGQR